MDVTFDCPYCDHSITADTSTLPNGRTECPGCHEIVLVPAAGIQPGMKLGDFRIDKCLGVGGMGEVFLAVQEAMDRKVALKVLPPAVTGNKTLVNRFLQEARMAGKLEHPNVVTAFYAGQDQGYYYLAMSYVDGEDLDERIKSEGRISEPEALDICLRVARALDYAWERHNLLHRDIKPANIMLTREENEVKLMDMGIAKALDEDSNLTMAGVMLGTPFYMSPEQAKNVDVLDCRSDIYALGATLFHLLTGSRPYEGPTAISVVAKHLNDPVPSPQAFCPEISLPTSRLIARMLAKEPADRPQDWKALAREIEEILASQHPHTLELKVTDSQQQKILRTPPPQATAQIPAFREDATIGVSAAATQAPAAPPPSQADNTLADPRGTTAAPPRTAKDYVDALPPNPEMPRSLKLLFGSVLLIMLIGAAIFAINLGWQYAQERKQDRQAEEERQRQAKLDEADVVAGVEGAIADRQTRAELETQAEMRRRELGDMLRKARDYRRDNPEDVEGAMEMFRKIREYARGTAVELEVDQEMRRLRQHLESQQRRRQLLAGTWTVQRFAGNADAGNKPNAMASLQLNADGTFTIRTRSNHTVDGTYTLTRETITPSTDDSSLGTWNYQLDRGSLTIQPREGLTVHLRRQ